MPFRCPDCSAKTLTIVAALELAPDSKWDELTLQTLACPRCSFSGVAVYQESRRGALDAEIVHHDGYPVGDADWKRLERAITSCPAPGDRRCACFAHRTFGTHNDAGRWNGLDTVTRGPRFTLEL